MWLKIALYIIAAMFAIFLPWHLLTRKFVQKPAISLWIAQIGAGKSSTMVKNILTAVKDKKTVYCNCEDVAIPGTRVFNTYDLGMYKVQNAQIEVDEISVFYDNRNYKQTSAQFIRWLRYLRHERLSCNLYTQSYDVDKKIRTLCQRIWFGQKILRVFTVWRKLKKSIALRDDALSADTQIADQLKFEPWWIPGNIKITFIPKYINYFDSFKSLDNYVGDLSYREVLPAK